MIPIDVDMWNATGFRYINAYFQWELDINAILYKRLSKHLNTDLIPDFNQKMF